MVAKTDFIKILLIDDDEDDYILTLDTLSDVSGFKFELSWESNYNKAIQRIKEEDHDIYLVDFLLGKKSGLDLIKEVYASEIHPPIIVLTGKGNPEIDFQAMREGASDYLVKSDITPAVLERSIRYAINNAESLKKVKESESKFRGLFEKSVDSIFIANTDCALQEVNESFLRLFSYTEEEVVDLNIKMLFNNTSDYEDLCSIINEEGFAKDLEYVFTSKNGNKLECLISVIPLKNSNDKIVGFQGILHDLTLRKKAERELLEAELLSVTGRIARSMAHEVRNPLTNLILALEQLKDELPEDNEYAPLFVDIISRNSERIDSIISEMLNTSKPNALNKEKFHLGDVIEESIQLINDRLTLKGMNIDVSTENLKNCEVTLDKEKLTIALCNIMVNAIEAMKEDEGNLQIQASNIKQGVMIEVIDNGHGISENHLSRMFNPFYTNKKGGVGLGLTTTKNIIEAHEGFIEIESEIGKGTNFKIILPC